MKLALIIVNLALFTCGLVSGGGAHRIWDNRVKPMTEAHNVEKF